MITAYVALALAAVDARACMFTIENRSARTVSVVAPGFRKTLFSKARLSVQPFGKAKVGGPFRMRLVDDLTKQDRAKLSFGKGLLAAGARGRGAEMVIDNGSARVAVGSRRLRVVLLPLK